MTRLLEKSRGGSPQAAKMAAKMRSRAVPQRAAHGGEPETIDARHLPAVLSGLAWRSAASLPPQVCH
jgi:hypothetical protein